MSTPTQDRRAKQDAAAYERSVRIERETVGHPAFNQSDVRTLPAGKGLFIIVLALGFALLFNSAGVLHLALGMRPGIPKDIAVSVVEPVDSLSHALWLDRPKQQLDRLFGHELDATGGTDLTDGSDAILQPGEQTDAQPTPAPSPTEPALVAPTTADPLRVSVMGDSLSTYVSQQLDLTSQSRKLIKIKSVWRDGTGLNAPEFFNWQAAAQAEVRKNHPQAVVMVLGGNDAQDMTHDGKLISPGSDEWQTEYARRIAVVMQTFMAGGVQRIYWATPPIAKSSKWDPSYKRINAAAELAAKSIPGARHVDTYNGSAVNGGYSDFAVIDGKRVRARQSDGVHWTFDGSRQPAGQILAALQADYGVIT